MCTAITYKTRDFYFGRTLDYEQGFGEEVTFLPRNFPLPFRHGKTLRNHFAILGMALVAEDYPLYFDGFNEKGLCMAGLNFVGFAHYEKPVEGKDNVAQFELIPWILGQCATVAQAKKCLQGLNITDTAFSPALPPAQLHWIIADREQAITVEAVREGLRVYQNPVGVLTNNPEFNDQLFNLRNYMHLSPKPPENRFAPGLDLKPYSRGMGAMGLPGDLSSASRFVRAAFVKGNAVSGEGEGISQVFHILGAVEQVRGCCLTEGRQYEYTQYTACCNATRGIYCYTTYENRQISAVDLHREDLEGNGLVRFGLKKQEQICREN